MAAGIFKRVVVFRLSPGEDVLAGIESVCNHYGIRHGVIISGIGSLNGARFCDLEVHPGSPAGYGYGRPHEYKGPIELLAVSGYISEDDYGKASIHIHCSLSDETGSSFGGHLVEGNKALITVELIIGEFAGISLDRRVDDNLGFYVMTPRKI